MHPFLVFLCVLTLYGIHIIKSFILWFVPRKFKVKKNIKGQTVLITGSGSGVGRQLAIEFSKHSTCLVLLDINKDWLWETEKLLERKSTVFIYQCDISDRRKVYEVAEQIKKDVGHVDILVNNAGVVAGKYFLDIPDEKIIKTIEVNALAHFWMCKAFLPNMMARNKGHLVSIASLAGMTGVSQLSEYCASKFAAVGFAESIELELLEKNLTGIKVTIVCPSHINSGLFDGIKMVVGGTMTPEYVAQEVVAGVLEEKDTIILPFIMRPLITLKAISPRWLCGWCQKMSGGLSAMENFRGRSEINKKNF